MSHDDRKLIDAWLATHEPKRAAAARVEGSDDLHLWALRRMNGQSGVPDAPERKFDLRAALKQLDWKLMWTPFASFIAQTGTPPWEAEESQT